MLYDYHLQNTNHHTTIFSFTLCCGTLFVTVSELFDGDDDKEDADEDADEEDDEEDDDEDDDEDELDECLLDESCLYIL